ncbi:phosphomannomutase/phosphoglucomutase [Luteimonas sp. MC1750]|uniref:phosphomannomutase/phosphoglucomutase n=1 Tax=Luteimonas sp. MC1750 TaxID=2799326 RepID=UPI0018F0C2F6|nr:phosphomannomutase/phosphoglucomutase [Luteimonas sp. MC1750]MBJ6985738.1 phosphomannomutase/phosphoglucomutase [Luteimonas sp. MC1750]QQO06066.1 phosphomannomutase/phosphoglucomutase [Luteimonas sp. MC1750]
MKLSNKTRQAVVQSRRALQLLAALLVLLAAWLAWTGWQQMQDGTRRSQLATTRDALAQSTGRALQAELARLEERMASTPVRAALADGDLAAASAALGRDWPNLESATIHDTGLAEAYATAAQAGYGRIAVAEAAMTEGRPVMWVVRDGDAPRLALAMPARVGETLVGVAYVRLPLARAVAGLDAVDVPGSTYLALRQGGFTLADRGDPDYAASAERMAVPVDGTGLRVAAGLPPRPAALFGLAALPSIVVAAILLLLAYVLSRLPSLVGRPESEEAAAAPTLEQALEMEPVMDTEQSATPVRETRPAAVAIDPGIFRAYDIRGIVGQSLDIGVAELIGHAIGSLMHEQGLKDIVVGRDGRLSGPDMVAGLTAGLRKAGRDVIDIGMVPTPVVYFGAYQLRTGCCVSVTGSHNPPDYNGFKIVVGGETLSGDAVTDLYARIAEDRLYTAPSPGGVTERDIASDYVDRIASDVQVDRPLKVVVDAGNGVAGEIGPRVLEAIGAHVEPLFCEIDGTFPNHHPDPSEPHNLTDLVEMVKRFDADLGIAFDGDGDRLGVVTKTGENIFPDRLLMLFAADVLERNPGAVIVYDVKCTGRLQGHILRHGGSPLMWKTGHSLIKAKMRETEAELAGEMSGHFFFGERWYGFDDGIYAAARLLEILASRPEEPSDVLAALPAGISTPEIKVDAPGGNPHAFVERFVAQAKFEGGARPSTIDGLRVDFPDGWGLVRASNTTPVLVLRFDADSQEALDRIRGEFRTQLLALDPDLPLPF